MYMMKNMRLLLLVVCLPVWYANAQPGNQKKPVSTEQRVEQLGKKLNLNEPQKVRLKEILDSARAEAKAIRTENHSREKQRDLMAAHFKQTDQRINEILQPEQREVYQKLKEEKRHEMKQRRKNRGRQTEDIMEDQGIL